MITISEYDRPFRMVSGNSVNMCVVGHDIRAFVPHTFTDADATDGRKSLKPVVATVKGRQCQNSLRPSQLAFIFHGIQNY